MRVAKLSTVSRFSSIGVSSVLGGLLIVASPASAEFAYTGIELGIVDVEFNSGLVDLDGDGYRIGGFYELQNRFFVHGSWENHDYDFGIDGELFEVGGGYYHPLGSDLDLVFTASLIQAEVEAGGFGVDDDGFGIGGGIRARVAESFQVEAMLDWVDYDEGGSDTGIVLKGRYYFNDQYSIGLETDFDDDFDTLTVGFRAEF